MLTYRCDITMHDYLFFATTERGKVAETGPFIHNYALTYALGWAVAEWRNDEQQPHYLDELGKVDGCYVTPARLLRGSYIVSQYNTMPERYSLGKGQSIGYPDWGFAKCFRPSATFRCYVISKEKVSFPRYLRLGKFMAKALLTYQADEQPKLVYDGLKAGEREDNPLLLNWADILPAARPRIYDILAGSLPTRLIANPVFQLIDGPYLIARFGDEQVRLPLRMGYLASDGGSICTSWLTNLVTPNLMCRSSATTNHTRTNRIPYKQ